MWQIERVSGRTRRWLRSNYVYEGFTENSVNYYSRVYGRDDVCSIIDWRVCVRTRSETYSYIYTYIKKKNLYIAQWQSVFLRHSYDPCDSIEIDSQIIKLYAILLLLYYDKKIKNNSSLIISNSCSRHIIIMRDTNKCDINFINIQ